MGRLARGTVRQWQALNRALVFAAGAPGEVRRHPRGYLRALRGALRMSQAVLARRSGVPQAHIARIEAGEIDPRLGTLRRLFDAMFCELLVLPRARKRPGDAVAERRQKRLTGALWRE